MRISDWSSDVCSSDLGLAEFLRTDEEVPINDRVHLFDHSLQIIEIEHEFIGVAATPVVISLPGRFQLARFFGHVVLRWSGWIPLAFLGRLKIGRASCRGRVGQYV